MKGLLFIFTSIAVFFLGCQTLTPTANTPFTKEWIGEYKRLRELPPSSETCEGFKTLLKKDFPLKEFAALKASTHCKELIEVDHPMPWLHEEWTKVKLKIAQDSEDKSQLIGLLVERSKQIPMREEKVKLVLQALGHAKKSDKETTDQIYTRLYKLAPRYNKNFEKKQSLSVARDFMRAREFNQARKIYLDVLNKKGYSLKEKMRAFEYLARLEKLENDKEDHAKTLKMYSVYLNKNLNKKNNKKYRSYILKNLKDNEIELARALWTMGKRSEAEKILHARTSNKKKLFSYAVHYWLLGRIEEEKKNTPEALKYLRLSIKEVQENSELESQARWFLAWNLYKSGEYQEALEHLRWFQEAKTEDFTKARALYWSGVTQNKLEQNDEAKKTFKLLSEFDPLGYYGLLAKRELKLPLTKPSPEEKSSESYLFRIKIHSIYNPEWVEWMARMDEKESLKNYLSVVTKDYSKNKDQDDRVWLHLFQSYAKAGEYLGLFQKLYEIKPEMRDRLLKDHPELLFPTPHTDLIISSGERFSVEPALIYSIIRQESAFNPEARSPADAFGLMQLLPRVAKQIGGQIGMKIDHYTDLYEPEKNIPLGAALIANQMKRHKNNFISTVASYNASDKAVRGWFESRGRPSSIEFIEEIPYEETKGYVRLIIRNYSFYQLFLSSHNETSFPEDLLAQNDR